MFALLVGLADHPVAAATDPAPRGRRRGSPVGLTGRRLPVVGCGGAGPTKGMGLVGFGRADLGEQGQCLLPVGQGGVRALWVERMAEDH